MHLNSFNQQNIIFPYWQRILQHLFKTLTAITINIFYIQKL